MTMVAAEDFKIVKGQDCLKLYQYHTKVAKHYFCNNCGIYTHHNPRSNPLMYGINLACLEEINTLELKNISLKISKGEKIIDELDLSDLDVDVTLVL